MHVTPNLRQPFAALTALVLTAALALAAAPGAQAADEPVRLVARTLSWSTTSVDVTEVAARITVEVTMAADGPEAPRYASLKSTTSTQLVDSHVPCCEDTTPMDRTFSFDLPQGAANGPWDLELGASFVDGHWLPVDAPPGAPTQLEVRSEGADIDPPVMQTFTVTPDPVNVAYRSHHVRLESRVVDRTGGVAIRARLTQPDGASATQDLVHRDTDPADVVSTWFPIYQRQDVGTWTVELEYIVDGRGNRVQNPPIPPGGTTQFSVVLAPDVPPSPLVTLAPSQRGSLEVSWQPPPAVDGYPVTAYDVTLLPAGVTRRTGADARRLLFEGLGDGTTHTARVAAVNALGTGTYGESQPTTTFELPSAPTQVRATARRTLIDVVWEPAWQLFGGVPTYTVTAHPDGQTMTVPVSTRNVTFSGLAAGTDHTFTVAATNAVGTGPSSSASAPVRLVTERAAPDLRAVLSSPDTASVTWVRASGFDTVSSTEVCRHRADGTTVGCQLTTASRASFAGLVANRTYGFSARSSEAGQWGPWSSIRPLVTPPGTGVGFTPTPPRRVLDTRSGLGASARPLGAGESLVLTVPGLAAGTTSVTLNLTGLSATTSTFVTAHAAGTPRPTASHLNLGPGETLASFVTVPVSKEGRVSLFNSRGTVHLLADLAGHVHPAGGSTLLSEAGTRILDTRYGTGAPKAPVRAGQVLTLTVPKRSGQTPTAAVVNLTVTGATKGTYVTAYPHGTVRPNASSVNVVQGRTVANLVVVPLDSAGRVNLWNAQGSVELVADLVGTYSLDSGAGYVSVAPTRIMDTRSGLGGSGPIGSTPVSLTLPSPPAEAKAVLLRTTVVAPTAPGNLVAHPAVTTSNGSVLNFTAGQTVGNHVVLPVQSLPTGGAVRFAMSSGVQGHLLVDVAGYYVR